MDPKKLASVQINDQTPPKKKIAGPKHSSLLQLESDIVMDLRESEKQKNKNKDGPDLAYVWTQSDDYLHLNEPNALTIADGMEKTGGYTGTDLDDEEDENLSQIQENADAFQAQHLAIMKKRRRQLREQILCSDNCQFEKWSYMTGVQLNENCPVDCPVFALQGRMDHHSSAEALSAYNQFPEIKNAEKNKRDLGQLDAQVDQQEEKLNLLVQSKVGKEPPR